MRTLAKIITNATFKMRMTEWMPSKTTENWRKRKEKIRKISSQLLVFCIARFFQTLEAYLASILL